MSLEWYLFEHSYLTGIDYKPTDCSLNLMIDAKMTFDHPKLVENQPKLEETYVQIEVNLKGVQYLRMVSSSHLLTNPNDDMGSIERFSLKEFDSVSSGFAIKSDKNKHELLLDLSDGNVASVFSSSNKLTFLDFVSENIAFEIGFEGFTIREID